MSYETKAALKSLQEEGLRIFLAKTWVYVKHLANGLVHLGCPRPTFTRTEETVDYAMQAAGGTFSPSQIRSEILALTTLVREMQPNIVVEIGTAMGGTLFLWCANAAPDATIISIDLPNGIHGGGYPYWKTFLYRRFARAQQRVHLWRGNSHDPSMHSRIKAELGERKIDFLFIDGDHTYEGVKTDFAQYAALVRPGGIVALHDIVKHPAHMQCDVDRFWNEIKLPYKNREFIENPNQGWGGIGVVWVP